jgi:hypothetical protein
MVGPTIRSPPARQLPVRQLQMAVERTRSLLEAERAGLIAG